MGDETMHKIEKITKPPEAWTELAGSGLVMMLPKTAKMMAELCGKFVGSVLGAKDSVADVVEVKQVSSLDVDGSLTRRINDRGAELTLILDAHARILTEMAAAFVAAGKTFADQDADSAADLDRIVIPTKAPADWSSDAPGRMSNIDLDRHFGLPDGLGPKITDGTHVPNPLPGTLTQGDAMSMVPEELVELHNSIDASGIAFAADRWHWAAGQLETQSETFRTQLGGIMKEGWLGASREKAADASGAYLRDFNQLTRDMKVTGDTLHYTGDALYQTWKATEEAQYLKSESDARLLAEEVDYGMLGRVRDGVNKWYWGHMDTSSGAGTQDKGADLVPIMLPFSNPFSTGPILVPRDLIDLFTEPTSGLPVVAVSKEQTGTLNFPPHSVFVADSRFPEMSYPVSPFTPAEAGSSEESSVTDGVGNLGGPSPGLGPMATGPLPTGGRNNLPSNSSTAGGVGDGLASLGQGLGNALQSAANAAKDLPGSGTPSTAPGSPLKTMSASAGPLAAGAKSGTGGGLGAAKELGRLSSQFPRAGALGPVSTGAAMTAARAGMASTAGTPGSPGSAGSAGRGAGQGENARKRAEYLDSVENMEEIIGSAQIVARPVLDDQ
ncbi:hypothetical protein AB0L63_26930 [Nocardia sp. NPDC051990]|uniref:hypothetical protein n=1 Tax=Nocardia sp. NPDC051990 TaxID=3155285 RepID=UPI00341A8466